MLPGKTPVEVTPDDTLQGALLKQLRAFYGDDFPGVGQVREFLAERTVVQALPVRDEELGITYYVICLCGQDAPAFVATTVATLASVVNGGEVAAPSENQQPAEDVGA